MQFLESLLRLFGNSPEAFHWAGGRAARTLRRSLPLVTFAATVASQDLQSWVDGAREHGFVLVSFGAGVKYLSEDIAHKLAGALGRLPQKVIWRYGLAQHAISPCSTLPEAGDRHRGPAGPAWTLCAFLVWEVQVEMQGDVGMWGVAPLVHCPSLSILCASDQGWKRVSGWLISGWNIPRGFDSHLRPGP